MTSRAKAAIHLIKERVGWKALLILAGFPSAVLKVSWDFKRSFGQNAYIVLLLHALLRLSSSD